jgi:hypothetical protein
LIAPIILGFAFIGLMIIYVTYRYNILYIYSSELDTRGLNYPRALKQTLTGVYLAEICLVGLFGLKAAFGPVVMMLGLLIFTFLINISLIDSLSPLLFNLPRTLAVEEELRRNGDYGLDLQEHPPVTEDLETAGYDSDFDPSDPHGATTSRAIEGGEEVAALTRGAILSYIRLKINKSPLPTLVSEIDFWSYWITPDPTIKPNFLVKFLHPEIFADYSVLRDQVPESWRNGKVEISNAGIKDAYVPPSVRSRAPRLVIPRDPAGVSRQEVAHSGKVIEIDDSGVWLDDKGRIEIDLGPDRREAWDKIKF